MWVVGADVNTSTTVRLLRSKKKERSMEVCRGAREAKTITRSPPAPVHRASEPRKLPTRRHNAGNACHHVVPGRPIDNVGTLAARFKSRAGRDTLGVETSSGYHAVVQDSILATPDFREESHKKGYFFAALLTETPSHFHLERDMAGYMVETWTKYRDPLDLWPNYHDLPSTFPKRGCRAPPCQKFASGASKRGDTGDTRQRVTCNACRMDGVGDEDEELVRTGSANRSNHCTTRGVTKPYANMVVAGLSNELHHTVTLITQQSVSLKKARGWSGWTTHDSGKGSEKKNRYTY
ncbi:hypothetical protein K438DRAFT_1941346 [Mycena galopus ATCC 62051]|nr:hypothetical protein K438DRAFT_1941346 [Mycena galopus ATCC 62051]